MLKSKIFILITLFSFVSLAEEVPDYERVFSGDCVTQDGFFFNEKGMIRLVVNTEEKIKVSNLEKQKEVDLLKIDLQKCNSLKQTELNIQKQMYEKQLEIKQKTIDSYVNQTYINNIKLIGVGLLGIGIGALAVGIINLNK